MGEGAWLEQGGSMARAGRGPPSTGGYSREVLEETMMIGLRGLGLAEVPAECQGLPSTDTTGASSSTRHWSETVLNCCYGNTHLINHRIAVVEGLLEQGGDEGRGKTLEKWLIMNAHALSARTFLLTCLTRAPPSSAHSAARVAIVTQPWPYASW